jgi:hypothetical protein
MAWQETLLLLWNYIIYNLFPRVWEMFITPWKHVETLWAVLPLILILVLIHLYFGRHKTEQLGWNSAFGNSISLLWICVILVKLFFTQHSLHDVSVDPLVFQKSILLGLLLIWVFVQLVFNFFHTIPKRFAFVLSSADSVYILAYILISIIAGRIMVDKHGVLAAVVLFCVMVGILEFIKYITPGSARAERILKKREQKKEQRKFAKKNARKKKFKKIIQKIGLFKQKV